MKQMDEDFGVTDEKEAESKGIDQVVDSMYKMQLGETNDDDNIDKVSEFFKQVSQKESESKLEMEDELSQALKQANKSKDAS